MPRRTEEGHHVTRHTYEDRSTNKLLWIGVGIVVGLVLLKQLPDARRYMRLERM